MYDEYCQGFVATRLVADIESGVSFVWTKRLFKRVNSKGKRMTTGVRFESPDTAQEAAKLLAQAQGGARILAGGTDLLVQMRSGRLQPEVIVNVKGIDEIMTIRQESGGFRVGAAVPCMSLVNHEAFSSAFPGVIDGANLVGSVQVRGRASMGGNLCNASPAADSVPAMIAAGALAAI